MQIKLILQDPVAKMLSLVLPAGLMRKKRYFSLWENRGYHVTPVHFYEPIPDTRSLKNELWEKRSELIGIDINEKKQLELLSSFVSKFRMEYGYLPQEKTSIPYEYYINNGSFSSVDGEILYCMIRHFKPKAIFEIGSGNSTYLSAQAVLKNREEAEETKCELVAVDPYPKAPLKVGFPGLSTLKTIRTEDIPLSEFAKLGENDILFIDSSHVLKIGSDVQYLYLEVLPRLNKGVIIHLHDIFLPAEYPRRWILKDHFFWNEQYLLQAFLCFNESFEVLWAGSYMHLLHPDKLEMAFNSYKREERWPGSFWIKKVK